MVRGAEWRETMKECTSARSIFRERGQERALLRAVAEPLLRHISLDVVLVIDDNMFAD